MRALFAVFAVALTLSAQTNIPALQDKSVALGLVDLNDLMPNATFFGAGYKSGANLNGVSAICHAVATLDYLCVESKFSGSTTANTFSLKHVLIAHKGLIIAANGNAGLATGANGGSGAAYAAGGSLMYNVSRLSAFKSHPGYYVGFSSEWDKRNVNDFVALVRSGAVTASALRPFASQGTYTFFFGLAWK